MNIIIIILLSLASYLLGSFPSGYVLTKIINKTDIRQLGSKNTGATNTARIIGPAFGVLALLLDVLKGIIIMSILLIFKLEQFYLIGNLNIIAMYGVFAVLGHVFSIFLNFQGGKAVATSFGVLIILNPWLGLVAVVAFFIVAFATRYVSLSSMIAAVSSLIAAFLFYLSNPNKYILENVIAILIMTMIIVVKHKDNIKRMLNKTESRIGTK